jgi:3-oxoacyl-(acyl-carrier-protein) reductase
VGALDNKTAIVTGAARGIGRAIALTLAREGADVAINYRSSEAEARAVAEEIEALGRKAMSVRADVSVPGEARNFVREVVDRWGRLDILVNNAGITRDRTLQKLNDEDWLAVINNNLNSVFYCTSAAVPTMVQQQYGRIVSIASVVGQAGNFGQANYSAAKAGIIALTKTAALELARFNITVNTVAPGFTATDMVTKIPAEIQAKITAKIPLARFAEPEEIAEMVLFLVTKGDYITGQQMNVNGGVYM